MRWVDRKFRFDTPLTQWEGTLARLRVTAERIAGLIYPLEDAVLTWQPRPEKWSLQEHLGHLIDLDHLHYGRLDDYESGAKELRPADVRNPQVRAANYNARRASELLEEFRRERGRFVKRLEKWPEAKRTQASLHPRLKQPMRVIDLAFFVAEHDDHHLAVMRELAQEGEEAVAAH